MAPPILKFDPAHLQQPTFQTKMSDFFKGWNAIQLNMALNTNPSIQMTMQIFDSFVRREPFKGETYEMTAARVAREEKFRDEAKASFVKAINSNPKLLAIAAYTDFLGVGKRS